MIQKQASLNKNRLNILFLISSIVFTIGLFALGQRKLILALALIFSIWSIFEYNAKNSAKTLGVMSFFLGSLVLFALYFGGSLPRIYASILLLAISLGFFALVNAEKTNSKEGFALAIISPVSWLLAVLVLEKFLALTYFPILTTFGAMILTLVFWLLLEVYSRMESKHKQAQMLGILLVWIIIYVVVIATVSLNTANLT